MKNSTTWAILSLVISIACLSSAHAQTVTWDGGGGDNLWVTTANWSGTPDNTPPANGNTVNIGGGVTVSTAGISALHAANQLPNGATVNLTGSSTLTDGADGVLRFNGSTLNVSAGSTLTGGFWDLNNGTLNFEDGAVASMNFWEQKGTNVFNFELGTSGFTTLTPGTLFISGGKGNIANATYNVDMAAYTGPPGTITLVDFTGDASGMDNATFQTSAGGLNVINAGSYTASLEWDDATDTIRLVIDGDLGWDGGGGDGLWVTTANWAFDVLPGNGDTVTIDGGVTVSTAGISALHGANQLPNGATINLNGNSTLTDGTDGVLRLNGATINVASGSTLTGGFWDLNNATLNFEDGAIATMGNWEQRNTNVFNFKLSASGFTALTPGTFRIAGGSSIAGATYNVDMADYTGGAGIITLVDFGSDAAGMDNSTFQTSAGGLNVTNIPSGLDATLQWNDTTEAIELVVTSTSSPTVPNIIAITIDGSGNVTLTLDGSESGLTAQRSSDLSPGSFVDVASTPGTNTLTIDAANADPNGDGSDYFRVRN